MNKLNYILQKYIKKGKLSSIRKYLPHKISIEPFINKQEFEDFEENKDKETNNCGR